MRRKTYFKVGLKRIWYLLVTFGRESYLFRLLWALNCIFMLLWGEIHNLRLFEAETAFSSRFEDKFIFLKIWISPKSNQKISFPPQTNLIIWSSPQNNLKKQFPPQTSLGILVSHQTNLKFFSESFKILKLIFLLNGA